ncbi:putative protein phosphatase 2C 38 [Triticum urartu]|uniref:protein-serine/threonine phosphatase n=1 Tax=Triticum urartu TaxID=4572 RepID=M7YZU5_TRIUA|nr:putative protein phosphatase 2C 38 [Triticum urartu]
MEEVFLNHVRKQWLVKPQISSVGSCCLVGIINEGVLYIANTGDSCVVPGRVERGAKDIKAVQLSSEHNASFPAVRDELRQVSRMIGHTYLKSSEFNHEPLLAWFHIRRPFHNPILCPEPSIEEHRLCKISVCYICIRWTM